MTGRCSEAGLVEDPALTRWSSAGHARVGRTVAPMGTLREQITARVEQHPGVRTTATLA